MTSFADYAYYKDTYKGKILQESDADYFLERASDIVYWKTGRKASATVEKFGEEATDFNKVQDATCEIAEVIFKQNQDGSTTSNGESESGCGIDEGMRIASESVDGFSINYDLPYRADSVESQAQFERMVASIIQKYLDFTRYGYRGAKLR